MKMIFPVVLALAWIALVAMTLTDFAGFTSATKPLVVAPAQVAVKQRLPKKVSGTAPSTS